MDKILNTETLIKITNIADALLKDIKQVKGDVVDLPVKDQERVKRIVDTAIFIVYILINATLSTTYKEFYYEINKFPDITINDKEWDLTLRHLRGRRYSASLSVTNLIANIEYAYNYIDKLKNKLEDKRVDKIFEDIPEAIQPDELRDEGLEYY